MPSSANTYTFGIGTRAKAVVTLASDNSGRVESTDYVVVPPSPTSSPTAQVVVFTDGDARVPVAVEIAKKYATEQILSSYITTLRERIEHAKNLAPPNAEDLLFMLDEIARITE